MLQGFLLEHLGRQPDAAQEDLSEWVIQLNGYLNAERVK